MNSIAARIAKELDVKHQQVEATIGLIDGGATIPFIARYRKEITGALDDTQLRKLDDRLRYLRELEDRRRTVLSSIEEQGKLSDELKRDILSADDKARLEDLYLPYKPKRRTKGQMAIEAGLEPLAEMLFSDPQLDPETSATKFITTEHSILDTKAALDGAKYILMERFSEDAKLLAQLKSYMWDHGNVTSSVIEAEKNKGEKFQDYFDYHEAIKKIPSHRALALFRGRNEGILNVSLVAQEHDANDRSARHPCETRIAAHFNIKDKSRPADGWLKEVVRWAWRVKITMHIESDLMSRLRESAELVAIQVFAENMKDLLLAAPAGAKATIGLDPGLRTGVKVAVIDKNGKLVDHATIYPHAPKNQWDMSIEVIAKLARKHKVELISIGNGTASRETEKLSADLMSRYPELALTRIMVSEAGASIYSASEFAALEFPDLDVTIRGAVSIARRLQDPLAELVKIEPKAIGVGQYQHDVSQVQLNRSLTAVVEDCVNAVGVDVNTASAPLLARVSGLSQSIANNIVTFRDECGSFSNRKSLKKVPRLGEKAFEQCAGFLRIRGGDNLLDASAVHPESYHLVAQFAKASKQNVEALIGNAPLLSGLAANDFVSAEAGEMTIKDIINELSKPGRDPRPEFKFAAFKDGIETLSDLIPNMILEGSVTNVTHFGAFVDIGVHQDGLVHISALANTFIKDPREIVKTGDIVKVKVIEVDVKRKRIALTMRLEDSAERATPKERAKDSVKENTKNRPKDSIHRDRNQEKNSQAKNSQAKSDMQKPVGGAMAAAFSKAGRTKAE
mgnify:CR=1 FL=1